MALDVGWYAKRLGNTAIIGSQGACLVWYVFSFKHFALLNDFEFDLFCFQCGHTFVLATLALIVALSIALVSWDAGGHIVSRSQSHKLTSGQTIDILF